MVTTAETLHHEDNDSMGLASASAAVRLPKTSIFIYAMLARLTRIAKLQPETIMVAVRQLCCFSAHTQSLFRQRLRVCRAGLDSRVSLLRRAEVRVRDLDTVVYCRSSRDV